MPNIKSAKKRLRTSLEARERNRKTQSMIKHARRGLMHAAQDTAADKGAEAYRRYCSILDKAAGKGVIKKNTAIRRKRRAANRLRKTPASG